MKFQYQWVSYDGTTDTDIEGATESAYRLQAAEEGKTLKVRVSFTDRHGYAESVTSAETATVLAAAPNVPPTGAPTISGPTHVSGTLTASVQGIDDQNGLRHAAFRYRWTATEGTTDTVVQDSENPIYVLEEADEGKTVQVDATFTDDDGYEETLLSVPTGAIGPRPNRPATGDPTVVGTVQVGETLTVDISDIEDADGLDNVSFSYQWLAGDADIAGATGDSYTLVADDKDKTISVRVSFTDRRDFEETLTSAATAPVENSQRVDLHILNAPVGEHEAVLYRSTATLTPVNHIGNTHDSREDRNADFKLTEGPTVTLTTLTALDRRQVGELAAAISATALTIPLTSIDGLRVGESIEIGAGGGELMRIASVDSDNKTITVVERYKAHGESFVEPQAWPADTVVYHHRRARPERLPDYMVESGKKPSFTNFRMSWSGLDVPYLAINMSFAGSDTELKDWRELLVYLRFRRADGEGRMVEGILPLGADGEMNLDDRQPGNPYTVREQHLRRYFGWPEDLDNDPDASVEVSIVDDARRNSRFISGDERTFLQDVVDWIYADDGHDLGRIYPSDDRYAADEAEVLQASPDTVSEELVRSYQVVVDVAFLDGTEPRIDTDHFSILTSGRADVIDLGDIGGAIASSTRSGSVNRSGDEYDHYRFTLSVPREVQLELTNLSGAAELVLESGSRTHLLRSDESGLQDELIITVLDAGVYQVRVQAQGGGTIDYQLRYRTALPAGNSPATGVPSISGTAQVGETLTVDTSGIDDADGMSGAVFSYQWLANDAEIAGATDPTYTLVDADAGLTVKVKVSFFDDKNNPETLTSEATTEVLANVPGSPEHLNVSLHDAGALDVSWEAPASDGGSAITGYKVQWKRAVDSWDTPADVFEATATGTTHTITGLTDGVEYAVRVIAVNDEGDGPPSDEATGTPRETTPPGLSTATVDGATLTLTYDEGLDENSEPSSDAFSVTVGGTGRPVDGVSVSGSSVILTLGSAVTAADTVTLSYTVPTDAAAPRIQDEAGNPAASFSDQDVENNTPPPANAPATGAPTITGTAQVGETLTADISGIGDADGLDNATFSYQWIAGTTDISGATGSTYTLVDADAGLTIKVKVSFFDDKNNPETLTSAATTAVLANVPDAPEHLNVSLHDTGALDVSWEAPARDGGSDITGYKVQWKRVGDSWDTPADVFEATVTGATHTITGLTDGVGYAVRIIAINDVGDGPPSDEATGTPRDTTSPTVTSLQWLHSTDGTDDIYTIGDELYAWVEFSEWVSNRHGEGTPRLRINLEDDKHGYGQWDTSWGEYNFIYRVTEGVMQSQGVSTGANPIELNGGDIEDAAGNDAILDHPGIPANREFVIDGVRPKVESLAITSDPGEDKTYGVGDVIEVSVTFSEDVRVPSRRGIIEGEYGEWFPVLTLQIGNQNETADFFEVNYTVVKFTYTVAVGDSASNGIAIPQNALSFNNGILEDDVGTRLGSSNAANLDHSSLTADSGHIVHAPARQGGLRLLELSGIPLAFDPAIDNYSAHVANDVMETTVTATANDHGATYVVQLGGVTDDDRTVSLAVGENVITIEVTAEDDTKTRTYTITVTRSSNTPATGAPTVTGTAQVGETLTADISGIGDDDGLPAESEFDYQWIAGTTDISGATGSSYAPLVADLGKTIKVRVSFEDDQNNFESLTSEATAAVEAKPNSPATGAPTISGTVRVGEILTAHTSDIADPDGLNNVEYNFNWGAGDYLRVMGDYNTYRVQARDVGLTIKVWVGFTDEEGNLEILTSVDTVAVVATTPAAPQHLNVSHHGAGALDLSWEAPIADWMGEIDGKGTHGDGGSPITGYKVQWKSGSEDYDGSAGSTRQAEITDPASRTHTITGLTDGVEYAVRVIAVNDVGDGPPSDEATGTPRETTPPELATATVDGPTLTLTYDEDLDENSEPSSDAFSVTVGGTGRTVDGVSVSGSSVIP